MPYSHGLFFPLFFRFTVTKWAFWIWALTGFTSDDRHQIHLNDILSFLWFTICFNRPQTVHTEIFYKKINYYFRFCFYYFIVRHTAAGFAQCELFITSINRNRIVEETKLFWKPVFEMKKTDWVRFYRSIRFIGLPVERRSWRLRKRNEHALDAPETWIFTQWTMKRW